MTKSPTLKIANFSDHKHLLGIRSQRAKQRESITNHKRLIYSTHSEAHCLTSEEPCHYHHAKPSLKTLRKNAPLSEEDFSRFVYQLDLGCNSFQIVSETTRRIRKMLSVERSPPIDKVIRSGAVPYLMRLLDAKEIEKYYHVVVNEQNASELRSKMRISKSQLSQLQVDATWAITNIVSGTSDHARYIVELGCVPLLMQLLSSEDDELKEQTAWAIGNIAAIWAISNLLRGKPIPQWNLISSAIPLLCDLILNTTDEQVLMETCWSFSHVTGGVSEAVPIIIKCGAMKKLVELMTSHEQGIQIPVVRAIGNLVSGSDEETQVLISLGVLNQFTTLLHHAKKPIQREVVWAISNITAGTKEQIQAVIDANLFPKLMKIISSQKDVELKREAYWACSNALGVGTLDQIQYLIELGIITVFCDSLTSRDMKTVLLVLERLALILKEATVNNSLDKVITSMESCGGLNKVKALKETSKIEVVSAALKILDFIKEEETNDKTGL